MIKHILSIFLLAFMAVCSGCSNLTVKADMADILYVNNNIWTGVEGAEPVDRLAVKDGNILYLGASKSIEAHKVVDLGGQFVMPGFIDNHVHFMEGGAALSSVDLRDANTPDEFSKRIIEYAKTRPEGAWVLNGNYEPYSDEPDNSGFPIVEPKSFADWMRAVDNAAMPLTIHAIGDKAIDVAISVMRDKIFLSCEQSLTANCFREIALALSVKAPTDDCFLCVESVFGFVKDGALRAVNDAGTDFFAAVSGQAV